MNVAPFPNDSEIHFQEGDFGHAVDDPGYFVGFVAGWPAIARWWQLHSLAARSRRCRVDYQSR